MASFCPLMRVGDESMMAARESKVAELVPLSNSRVLNDRIKFPANPERLCTEDEVCPAARVCQPPSSFGKKGSRAARRTARARGSSWLCRRLRSTEVIRLPFFCPVLGPGQA